MLKRKALAVGALALSAALLTTACTSRGNQDDTSAGGDGGGGDEQVTVAFVPKLQGVPYFEAMDAGGKAAAEELGIEWLYQGPTTADAAAQADIVRSFI
ncbi:MAG: rhamnose ABC transporter substrate-binding protein, partial [Mycetocola sp.]